MKGMLSSASHIWTHTSQFQWALQRETDTDIKHFTRMIPEMDGEKKKHSVILQLCLIKT